MPSVRGHYPAGAQAWMVAVPVRAWQRLARPLSRLLAPNARVILSGLLPSQANAALAAYAAQGLRVERRLTLDGWVTLVLIPPS